MTPPEEEASKGTSRVGGNDPDGHASASSEVAIVDRPDRKILVVAGRAPARMLTGLISGRIPPPLESLSPTVRRGHAYYSLLLTPKGKIVSDMRVARIENEEDGAFLLELPAAGVEGAIEHMGKYLPPRFARLTDADRLFRVVSVVGPRAAALIELAVPDLPDDRVPLDALAEGEEVVVQNGTESATRIIRSGDVSPPAWDLVAPVDVTGEILERLGALGAPMAPAELCETLRVEHGRPAFGPELGGDTLPTEAGIDDRAIDHAKGCYTGQEVIVRIRHRGKVNRRLRGALLGETAPPPAGTPLYAPNGEKPVGETTSSVRSPRFGQSIALAYVRSEVEPPSTLRLGTPEGPAAEIRALGEDGWVLVEGDAISLA